MGIPETAKDAEGRTYVISPEGEQVPKELTDPKRTPGKEVAGELGMKYGDEKTAETGGLVYGLGAALKRAGDESVKRTRRKRAGKR